MRKFKITSNIMLIVAISLFMLSVIIPSLSESSLDSQYLVLVQLNSLLFAGAGIGVFLKFTRNDVARKIGDGLTVVGFVVGASCALPMLLVDTDDPSIGAIIMLVSVVLLLLHYAFLLVNYLLNKGNAGIANPNEDVRVIRIREWKQLKEEGIITEEEFEEKRLAILGIKKQ